MRAQLVWLAESGAYGLAACDETLLNQRRQRYRDLARLNDPGPPVASPAPPSPPLTEASTQSKPAVTASSLAESAATNKPETAVAALSLAEPVAPNKPETSVASSPSAPQRTPSSAEPEPPRSAAAPGPGVASSAHHDAARVETSTRPTVAGGRWEERLSPLQLSEDAQRRLSLLAEEVRDCTRCSLHRARTQTVFARGSGRSGICFVGEGPGAEEDAQGLPFVGPAGQLLDKMIGAMGFDRDDVYVCNIVKCRPPKNRKPEPDEMAECRGYLNEQLSLLKPRVIVALGATAVQGLLGLSVGIMRLRGQWRVYRGEIPVMPTFHPAYLLRQPSAKRQVWEDLQQVLKHLGLSAPGRGGSAA